PCQARSRPSGQGSGPPARLVARAQTQQRRRGPQRRVMGVTHVENLVDLACRTAISYRGVAHITFPTDLQDQELSRKQASKRNLPHHTSDVCAQGARLPPVEDLRRAADILNAGKRVAILAGQGALRAGEQLEAVAERLPPLAALSLGQCKAVLQVLAEFFVKPLFVLGHDERCALVKTRHFCLTGRSGSEAVRRCGSCPLRCAPVTHFLSALLGAGFTFVHVATTSRLFNIPDNTSSWLPVGQLSCLPK